ncbi:hypothetical protein PVK06_012186 [Gossypium arboreum]|uniref:Uncharacterized protein n=1 Tax=Gossypium arboreum TaxID=29729 RepID=A0ABR0QB19_GOSAR|nr:hypothetical protein PVK06_012186 [Gossypium arboreum]
MATEMLFYLTMLNMEKFLKDDPSIFREDEKDAITAFNIVEAWKNSNFLCHNYVLKSLSDEFYEVQEFQQIIHGILAKGMEISESFRVAAIIENFPLLGMTLRTILNIRERK